MISYRQHANVKDLRNLDGRIVLAYGEVSGHHHEVCAETPAGLGDAAFFEEPDGRRVLLVTGRCVLRHQEHDSIVLDPERPAQVRQGDVLLTPMGGGAWAVSRQREYAPDAIRNVLD